MVTRAIGLVNAPSLFARLIQRVIASLMNSGSSSVVQAYIDDIIIGSDNTDDALIALKAVLRRIRETGLTLKLSKCKFLMSVIEFLGCEISKDGVRPGQSKVEAVKKFPQLKNVHEVRQTVGLASYFRKYIKNFALIAKPLTLLTKKDEPWAWNKEQDDAFTEIKEKLITRPVLALYKQGTETELHTDASIHGLAGILMQQQSDGSLRRIVYFSRQTTKEERRYHSYELETLAVVSSLHRFRVYLIGIPF